jgi:diguanylate cyclase (GGDEF)-like protein/PAS domain S-box-containing protein
MFESSMTSQPPLQPTLNPAQILEAVAKVSDALAIGHDLEPFLQRVVDILRQLLDTDRVVVYRFLPNDEGVIAAESVAPDWRSLRGELIYDPCFAGQWGERYRQGQVSRITDVQQASLEPCYLTLLTWFQVQANLVVPVFAGGNLWALLIAHHCRSPRDWCPESQLLLEHIARQVGQGVYQSQLHQQIQLLQWQINRTPTLSQAETLLQLFADHVDPVLFIRNAVSGQFLYISAAYESIWDQPRTQLYQDPTAWLKQVHPEDRALVNASIDQQVAGQSVQREYRIVRPTGEIRWIQTRLRVVGDDGLQPRYLVGLAEDCTDRKQIQAYLKTTEATLSRRVGQEQLLRMLTARMRESLNFETILKATVAGIKTVFSADRVVIFQILPNGDRRIVQQSTHSGYPTISDAMIPPGPLPTNYLERLSLGQPIIHNDIATDPWPGQIATFLANLGVRSAMVAPIAHPSGVGSDCQPVWGILIVHACGEQRQWQPFEANMLQHFGDQLTTALHQSELYRQLQAANQELDRLAKVDSLTQLANRRWLDDYLQQAWQRLARQQQPLSVVLADVDFFKPYNDTYGHAAGDHCLIAIAGAISQGIHRPADLAARYGGEEFALVLPDTDQEGAIQVVQLVRQALQALALPHGANPHSPTMTLSFGIATAIPSPDRPSDSLLEDADQALYAAKAAGRNCYQVFSGCRYTYDPPAFPD